MSINAVVADDHQVIRLGVSRLLEGSEIEIVGEATTGQQAVTMTHKSKPDVLLLDVRLPDGDGLTALPQIRKQCPETAVVMFSAYDNPTYVARSAALGASDYLLKGCSRHDLISTIRAAVKGIGPAKTGQMANIVATMENQEQIEKMKR